MSLEKNYILLELKPLANVDEGKMRDSVDSIRNHLKEFDIALVYPTHDEKCYIGMKTGNIHELKGYLEKNPVESSLFVNIKPVELENEDKISTFAFYQLKEKIISVDFPEEPIMIKHHLKEKYGLDYLRLAEIDMEGSSDKSSAKAHYMLRLDSYQKKMMDYVLSSPATESSASNDIASKASKAKENDHQVSSLNSKFSKTLKVKDEKKIENEMTFGSLKVEIFQGNLVKLDVDVIVNAANVFLLLGGGIAGAIANACGPKVQRECNEYLSKYNTDRINVSEVMHTNAFNIPARFIIHAAGPRFDDYDDPEQCYTYLKDTFLNVLRYTDRLEGVESIGIPLISSGIFGVPKEACCKALYLAIEEFDHFDGSTTTLKTIRLVNIDKETTDAILSYFNKMKPVNIIESNDEKEEEITPMTNVTAKSIPPKDDSPDPYEVVYEQAEDN